MFKPFKKLDDEIHFWMGLMVSFLAFFICDFALSLEKSLSIAISFAAPVWGGFAKELYDLRIKKTKFDERDFRFTCLGGLFFPLLLVIIQITYKYL